MSLMSRIYLLILLALAPAFALLAFNHYHDQQRREAEAEAQALRSARLVSGELEQILTAAESLLSTAGQAPDVMSFREPECTAYLRRLERINPSAGIIAVAGPDGRTRCGGTPGTDLSDRPYFQQALNSSGLVVGVYSVGRASRVPVLPLVMRIETEEGPGVIATGLKLDWLSQHFTARYPEFPSESSLTITDRDGVILVRLPNREREGTPLRRYPEIAASEIGGTFRSTAGNTADGVARFVGFTSPNEAPAIGLSVAVGFPQAQILAQIRSNAMRNYLLLASIAALAFLAAALGGRLFVHRPVAGLLATIEDWRRGKMDARTDPKALPGEFAQIGAAFNGMAADLEAALRHKNVLLRELNHRVMNSLATISSLLTMQLRGVTDPEGREQFANAVSRIDAMALLYRRMQAIDGVETIDFAAFLHDLCRDLHASMMGAGTPCVVEADDLNLPPAQATPLTLIVNELLTNALKHGAGQEVPVKVILSRSDGRCRLAVRNPGSLPAGYDPTKTGGFGMKMIAAMVQQLRGELEARSNDGETEFTVIFTPDASSPIFSDTAEAGSETGGGAHASLIATKQTGFN